jgi:hypothetical protein
MELYPNFYKIILPRISVIAGNPKFRTKTEEALLFSSGSAFKEIINQLEMGNKS